jgi:hypothetical protein
LAALHYSTKDDIQMHNLVMSAALFKAAMEKAARVRGKKTDADMRLLDIAPGSFALKVYNRFQREREVGAVTVASYLLGQPAFYMPNEKNRILHLYWVKMYVRELAGSARLSVATGIPSSSVEPSDVDPLVQGTTAGPGDANDGPADNEGFSKFTVKGSRSSHYINYRHRGSRLSDMCLYEYFCQVGAEPIDRAPLDSFCFAPEHPAFESRRQYTVPLPEKGKVDMTWIPALHGQATALSNRGRNRGPEKILADNTYIENDIAECLLGLFVPWDKLPALFAEHAADTTRFKEPRDACTMIWESIHSILPLHIQRLAKNFRSLRRTKDEADKDRAARQLEIDEWEEIATEGCNFGERDYEEDQIEEETATTAQLQLGFINTVHQWAAEGTGLGASIGKPVEITMSSLVPRPTIPWDTAGGVHNQAHVKLWEAQFKHWSTAQTKQIPDDYSETEEERPRKRRKIESNYNSRQRHTIEPELKSRSVGWVELPDLRKHFKVKPTLRNLVKLVKTVYTTLNKKQGDAITMFLGRAMNVSTEMGGSQCSSVEDQHLVYVAGAGGTGKTLMIKAFLFGMDILERANEVLLMAPTGAAAAHIGGATLHGAIGLKVKQSNVETEVISQSLTVAQNRLAKITFAITDEISMVGQRSYVDFNNRAGKVWRVPTWSDAIFGGIPNIVFLGDFRQFAPVLDTPLWAPIPEEAKQETVDTVKKAIQLWGHVKDVLILDEQMRQRGDLEYQTLLERASNCTMTQADIDFLNTKTRSCLEANGLPTPDLAIRRLNDDRLEYNRKAIDEFAAARNQKIWIFAAEHSKPPRASSEDRPVISQHSMLSHGDIGDFKGPGLFFFTKDMPFMLLNNVATGLKLSNGKLGVAKSAIVDPESKYTVYASG